MPKDQCEDSAHLDGARETQWTEEAVRILLVGSRERFAAVEE